MCLYPKLIKNKKYTITKKNNGNIPECKDERLKYVAVGCGKCIECRKQLSSQWKCRLNEEILVNKGIYVTLTFAPDKLEELLNIVEINPQKIIENEIATYAIRHMLEVYRYHNKKSFRHWFITELGHEGTERIHLHGILFENIDIQKYWKYGHVDIGDEVNSKTINYIVKYMTKVDEVHKGFTGKILCSKGIGSNWLNRDDKRLNKFKGRQTETRYKLKSGIKINLPIYYRNRLWTEEEREQLWLNMLDKEQRFVLGKSIDVSNDENEYNKALEAARAKNKLLGYGDDSKVWDKASYDQRAAILKYQTKKNMLKYIKELHSKK